MANPIERLQALAGALKNQNQDQPTAADAVTIAEDFVRIYPGQWADLVASKNLVFNPDDPNDLFDFGTITPGDPDADPPTEDVYDRAGRQKRDRIKCLHALRSIRDFVTATSRKSRKNHGTAVQADAGKTPAEVQARIENDTEASLRQQIGDSKAAEDDGE